MNDFLTWLEKESDYNTDEKKSILKRLSEWILEIIDAINELIQGGSLNEVVADFAKDDSDRLKDIRGMFLEVLDGVIADGEGETKNTAEGGVKASFQGYAEDGKGKYKSNFPKGTPKMAKLKKFLIT